MRGAAVLFAAAVLGAAPPATADRFVAVTVANDFFGGQDRHYTAGAEAAFSVDNVLRLGPDPRIVVAIGQRLYTPNVKPAFVEPGDRPFAGWLYTAAQARTRSGSVVDHAFVSLGIIGPSARGRESQDAIHSLYNLRPVTGWRDQLRDEATYLAAFERAWPAVAGGTWRGLRYDVGLRAGASVGNVLTGAHAGVVIRYGTHLPAELPASPASFGLPREPERIARFGWHAWAGAEGRAVARNLFLDGNTRGESIHVDRRPLGFDVQAGGELAWPSLRVALTLVHRSKEYFGQKGADRYGYVTVTVPW